jgi:hypothetical protein
MRVDLSISRKRGGEGTFEVRILKKTIELRERDGGDRQAGLQEVRCERPWGFLGDKVGDGIFLSFF